MWNQRPIYKRRRREWVEWLLRGKEQGTGHLRIGNKYCCLGGACEVAGIEAESKVNYDQGSPVYSYDGATSLLPESVVAYFGFNHDNPNLCGEPAASLNDVYQWSFEVIAMAVLFEEEYQASMSVPTPPS